MKTNIKYCISSNLFKILKNKDINEITISELSKKSLISRSTFYNNFNNINEAINYKIDYIINNIFNLYLLNKNRKKQLNEFTIILLKNIENNKLDFIVIKKYFFNTFKDKLDKIFLSNIKNKNEYILKSGSIINTIIFYLEDKINITSALKVIDNLI